MAENIKTKLLYNPYVWLLIVSIIAYWPIAFNLFALKNDNIMVFLPFRYNISEALLNRHLPLWTPYMNAGFPMHGDIQSGAWNPVVWFFSLAGRYTLTRMHLETMLYIFIAGAGMYALINRFVADKKISFAFAACYMMCGFFADVAGNNILFLGGAAFVPVVLFCGINLCCKLNFKNSFLLALSLYFLLTASYPFFTIITGYILLALFISVIARSFYSDKKRTVSFLIYFSLSGIIFLLIAAPAIYSYAELLPLYNRGENISIARAIQNSMEIKSFTSIVFPQFPLKDKFISADLTMRNAYFGLLPLILMIDWVFTKSKTKNEWLFFIAAIIFLLYSSGPLTFIHTISYKFIPFIDHLRHPANGRLFAALFSLLFSAVYLKRILNDQQRINEIKVIAALISVSLIIILFLKNSSFFDGAFYPFKHTSFSSREEIKKLFSGFNQNSYLLLNIFIQLISFLLIVFAAGKYFKKIILSITVLNIFFFLQLSMPVTLVSKLSPKKTDMLLKQFPKGFVFPSLIKSIKENSFTDSATFNIIGHLHFYNKTIGFPLVNYNPTILNNTEQLIKDSITFNRIMHLPYAYLSDENNSRNAALQIGSFNNNMVSFITNANESTSLHLQQTFMKEWKAKIDGKNIPLESSDIAFMKVPVPAGKHVVQFEYEPAYIKPLLIISAGTLLICFPFLFYRRIRIKQNL